MFTPQNKESAQLLQQPDARNPLRGASKSTPIVTCFAEVLKDPDWLHPGDRLRRGRVAGVWGARVALPQSPGADGLCAVCGAGGTGEP